MAEPILFDNGTFSYEGRKYVFDARILYQVGGKEDGISLSRSHIIDAEFGVSLNRLYSDGFVVYRDVVGDVSRVIGVFDAVCVITMLRYAQQGDGGFDSEKVDESIVHSFVVDNVEIVERDGTSITYCIHIRGTEYQRLMNHVDYSDYALQQKRSVVDIVKAILVQHGGCQVDGSFDAVTSGVKFSYMSNGNDTVMTSIDYLMQKQFFYPDQADERMKFLVYDIQSGKYGMFQFGQSECPSLCPMYLSLDDTEMEEFTQQDMVKLASTSDMSRTDMILPLSKIVARTFSLDSNEFGMQERGSSAIANFFGGGDQSKKIHALEYDDSHNPVRDVSEWSNGENVYRDAVDMFMNWDSIRVNAGGVLGRKLMSMVSITVDQRQSGSVDDTTDETNRRKTRYQQLQGPWYVTDVRYIVKPNEGTFRQNLQLSRCFNVS